MEDDGLVNIMLLLSQTTSVRFQVMITATNVTALGMFVHIRICK